MDCPEHHDVVTHGEALKMQPEQSKRHMLGGCASCGCSRMGGGLLSGGLSRFEEILQSVAEQHARQQGVEEGHLRYLP